MIDLREVSRIELKDLKVGDRFINEDGIVEIVTFVSEDKRVIKSKPLN